MTGGDGGAATAVREPLATRAPQRSGASPDDAKPGESRRESRAEFEALLEPVLPRAYRAARYMTGDATEAEDLVQQAALLAWRGFDGFERGTNFRAWFLRILTNLNYTRLRREARAATSVSLDDLPDLFLFAKTEAAGLHHAAEDPAAAFLSRLDVERVRRAIADLPDEYREVAALYFVDDLSYREIAAAVGCPVGTVRSRLHRGRKLLQVALWELAEEHGIVREPAASSGR